MFDDVPCKFKGIFKGIKTIWLVMKHNSEKY